MSKVFIGIPTHNNQVTIGTARCLQTTGLVDAVVKMQGRSLLCPNFNDLFCQAVNQGADYFLLLHSDIEVTTDGWAAKMLDIMTREQVDVLSVLSPIKNTDDFSCGISNSTCSKRYRFSKDDVTKLPPTFRTADVRKDWGKDAVLMVNTGVLMIRCKKVQPDVFTFQMADIVNRKEGKCITDNVPEDWFFSMLLNKGAVPYACTREVELLHYGVSGWSNQI